MTCLSLLPPQMLLPNYRRTSIEMGCASPFTAALCADGSLTEQRVILKDGRTLCFAEYGDPDGEPVIYCHGWPGCRLEAENYDMAGKKLGMRIISIDRPGFGLSTYKKGYRIIDWPRDVLELADALGLARFAVLCISSGSAYALACARLIPERVTSCAVVGGMSPLKVQGEKLKPTYYIHAMEIFVAYMANTVPLIARILFWYVCGIIRKDPDKAMKQFIKDAPPAEIELLKDEAGKRLVQRSIAECSRCGLKGPVESVGLQVKDWGFRLQDITAHVSLWQGERDTIVFPAAAQYMASKLPNHTLHMIPDAGHLIVVRHHAEDVLQELLSAK